MKVDKEKSVYTWKKPKVVRALTEAERQKVLKIIGLKKHTKAHFDHVDTLIAQGKVYVAKLVVPHKGTKVFVVLGACKGKKLGPVPK